MADVKELNINNTTYDIKAKTVVNQNGGSLKYWTGTKAQYDAITTKDPTTLYNVTDTEPSYSVNTQYKNIGAIVQSMVPLTDAGLHLMDGSLIQMGIYSEFVEYMAELYGDGTNIPSYFCTESEWQASVTQYGSCGKFVYNNAIYYAWYYENSTTVYTTSITLGDTVTLYSIENGYITNLNKTAEIQERVGFSTITIYDATGWHARNSDKDELIRNVRLPKISDILQGTTDLNALGDLVEAGLPNITGNMEGYGNRSFAAASVSGAFTAITRQAPIPVVGETVSGLDSINNRGLNASQSNSIYGNSTTVQPQTIKAFYYIVIATSTKTDIQVDIDEIATDLNGKADNDLTNVTDTGYIKMAGAGMPSSRYIDLTQGASGTTYTAPANGWFYAAKWAANNVNGYIALENRTSSIATEWRNTIGLGRVYLPTRKGDVVAFMYDAQGTTAVVRFIYAQGSESEEQ